MIDLFGCDIPEAPPAPPSPDHRTPDYDTSIAAAYGVRWVGQTLRARVAAVIASAGALGLTDVELEQLAMFRGYAPSTVRKRRSELLAQGRIEKAGTRGGASVWVLVSGEGTEDA